MSRAVIDDTLTTRLPRLDAPVEVCDKNGTTVGHYVPRELYQSLMRAWVDANVTAEELERIKAEPRGRTLREIWDDLGVS